MIFDSEYESPEYRETKEAIVSLLMKRKKPLTLRQIRSILGTDSFLGDALEVLTSSGVVEMGGGILRPTYRYVGVNPNTIKTKGCAECGVDKPLIDFYQEWSGAPSAKCKACKSAAQRRRRKGIPKGK